MISQAYKTKSYEYIQRKPVRNFNTVTYLVYAINNVWNAYNMWSYSGKPTYPSHRWQSSLIWYHCFWKWLGAKQPTNHYLNQLDMSTARLRLKSPQSLYGTSTHPTMVTHRSHSWSWVIDSHPLLSMSISSPTLIPQMRSFKLWPLNYKVKVMGVVKWQDHTVSPVSNWFAFFLFHINQITIPEIQLFWKLTLKNKRSRSWLRSKVNVT